LSCDEANGVLTQAGEEGFCAFSGKVGVRKKEVGAVAVGVVNLRGDGLL